jgi:hypothetical protein
VVSIEFANATPNRTVTYRKKLQVHGVEIGVLGILQVLNVGNDRSTQAKRIGVSGLAGQKRSGRNTVQRIVELDGGSILETQIRDTSRAGSGAIVREQHATDLQEVEVVLTFRQRRCALHQCIAQRCTRNIERIDALRSRCALFDVCMCVCVCLD